MLALSSPLTRNKGSGEPNPLFSFGQLFSGNVLLNDGLKILDTAYAVEDYAAAMNKDNAELYEAVNKVLEELIADGTVASIIEKYIPAE